MNEFKRRTDALIILYVSVEGGEESLIDLFLVSCEKELKITTRSFFMHFSELFPLAMQTL